MRTLCDRLWNLHAKLTLGEPHSWDPRQRTTWSRVVTSDFNSVLQKKTLSYHCMSQSGLWTYHLLRYHPRISLRTLPRRWRWTCWCCRGRPGPGSSGCHGHPAGSTPANASRLIGPGCRHSVNQHLQKVARKKWQWLVYHGQIFFFQIPKFEGLLKISDEMKWITVWLRHTSLAPWSWFHGSRVTTVHVHQCCRFQNYAKTVPSRIKLTMKLTMREPTFMGSMTTDHVITACDVWL